MKLYEGMFIIDSTIANADWDKTVNDVNDILKNRGAEILKSEKWDERKLAYKIKNQKRGTYLLVYFNAPQDSITSIKRDLQLSDILLRSLIVKVDKIKEEPPKIEEKQEGDVSADNPEKQKPVPVVSESK